ncbi:hypothetical protein BB8028_0001g15910 [Beauveria bassiana]|uniref:Uncharacterized protein n=1 Tax=Beauveria bassiana TaxID=176275 RepID=A0A2S7Y064_BEABA|nr:hypothetical protein BB8028_0001g15910 [Beauveria bassiana]
MDPKKFMAPAAAFAMATVLFVYTRLSIRSARNQTRRA